VPPAAGRAARQPSADPGPGLGLVFGRARRARGALPDAGRAPAAGAAAARADAGRPRLALQGVAPGPRAQLLALALAALEQGVAALPAETFRWAWPACADRADGTQSGLCDRSGRGAS